MLVSDSLSLASDSATPELVPLTLTLSCLPWCPCRSSTSGFVYKMLRPNTVGVALQVPKCAYVFNWLHLGKFRANCYTIDWVMEWSKNVRGQNKQTVSQSGYSFHTDKARISVNVGNVEHTDTSCILHHPPNQCTPNRHCWSHPFVLWYPSWDLK